MKLVAAAAILAVCAFPVSAVADGPLAWQLIGTTPDVYAPIFPQPSRDGYFSRARLGERSFLHPRIGMSFAALRNAARCARDTRGGGEGAVASPDAASACLR